MSEVQKNNHEIFTKMENDIHNSNLDENIQKRLLKNLFNLKNQKLNILITGATGAGKSSTINAMFDMDVATVGIGVDPETMEISKFELGNMILWDTPGLGDVKEKDNLHAKAIIDKLNEKANEKGEALIDLVLVILDGSTRDLGTSYELINEIIIPNLEEPDKRLLVAINQADRAMRVPDKVRWDSDNNKPTSKAEKFLNEKVESVKNRIKEATNINIEPIFYCAGYKEEGEKQQPSYNLSKLMSLIVTHTPKKKRLLIVDNISKDNEMWKDNDDLKDYNEEIKKGFLETIQDTAEEFGNKGREIGMIFGKGEVGEAIGKTVGAVAGTFKAVWNSLTS